MPQTNELLAELWLEWVQDEQKVCTTDEERQFIVGLFERAVQDYTGEYRIMYLLTMKRPIPL